MCLKERIWPPQQFVKTLNPKPEIQDTLATEWSYVRYPSVQPSAPLRFLSDAPSKMWQQEDAEVVEVLGICSVPKPYTLNPISPKPYKPQTLEALSPIRPKP